MLPAKLSLLFDCINTKSKMLLTDKLLLLRLQCDRGTLDRSARFARLLVATRVAVERAPTCCCASSTQQTDNVRAKVVLERAHRSYESEKARALSMRCRSLAQSRVQMSRLGAPVKRIGAVESFACPEASGKKARLATTTARRKTLASWRACIFICVLIGECHFEVCCGRL